MRNSVAIGIKANAHYTCRECGSTELIQAHHEIPGDDDSLIALCAECHSRKHPNVPKALFFAKGQQPYWHNKSASSLARELGAHPRTIIRVAKRLGILSGELSPWDEELIKHNLRKKLKPEKANRIWTFYKKGYRYQSIANMFHIKLTTVGMVILRERKRRSVIKI